MQKLESVLENEPCQKTKLSFQKAIYLSKYLLTLGTQWLNKYVDLLFTDSTNSYTVIIYYKVDHDYEKAAWKSEHYI